MEDNSALGSDLSQKRIVNRRSILVSIPILNDRLEVESRRQIYEVVPFSQQRSYVVGSALSVLLPCQRPGLALTNLLSPELSSYVCRFCLVLGHS